jgi:hypothetical protein
MAAGDLVARIRKTEGEQMIRPDLIVRLTNSAGAKNHYERMVCQILEAEGPRRAAELVNRVAQEMYYEELRLGAGAVDIGIFGPTILEREVQEFLESMVGRCITVESEQRA